MQKTCIIIPCYNEALRLPVNDFISFSKKNEHIYFCFVNDGSNDNTQQVLDDLVKENNRMMVYQMPENGGKAEAIRQGVHAVQKWFDFDKIGYFDADLATPLSGIQHLEQEMDRYPGCFMAFGSRVKRMGTLIERSIFRHYFGRVFSTTSSIILALPVYDTQCGAKLFKASITADLFKEKFISRWLFDIELFARLINAFGYEKVNKSVIEVPLREWVERGKSKLKINYILKVPFELLRIHFRYRVRNNAKIDQ